MNQQRYKTHVEYYVSHGEGECDNKTFDLREAMHIRADLLAAGHSPVYIYDGHDEVVDSEYIARIFVNVRPVNETIAVPEDEDAAGLYQVVFAAAVLQEQALHRQDLAEIGLRIFHARQAIENSSDFLVQVVDAFGRVVEANPDFVGFGEGLGDIEKIGCPLTELLVPNVPFCSSSEGDANMLAVQTLTAAMSEVLACLDGLGVPVAFNSVHGDHVDWMTRARYIAEVALGRRVAYPDPDTLGEWVGLHYKRDFNAEPAEKRAQWAERYLEAHA